MTPKWSLLPSPIPFPLPSEKIRFLAFSTEKRGQVENESQQDYPVGMLSKFMFALDFIGIPSSSGRE